MSINGINMYDSLHKAYSMAKHYDTLLPNYTPMHLRKCIRNHLLTFYNAANNLSGQELLDAAIASRQVIKSVKNDNKGLKNIFKKDFFLFNPFLNRRMNIRLNNAFWEDFELTKAMEKYVHNVHVECKNRGLNSLDIFK